MSPVRVGGRKRAALLSLIAVLLAWPVVSFAATGPGDRVPPGGSAAGRPSSARPVGADPAAPKYSRNQTAAQQEANQPYAGGSRGNTPIIEGVNVGGRSSAPAKQPARLLNKYPNHGRGLPNPDGKRYTQPRPQMDAWQRDSLGRAVAARIRSLRDTVIRGAKSALPSRSTRINSAARAKVPGIDGFRVKTSAQCKKVSTVRLVADQFGGYGDDPRNLVPLSQDDRDRLKSRIEDKVRSIVLENNKKFTDFVYYVQSFYSDDGNAGQRSYPTKILAYIELTRSEMKDGRQAFNQTLTFQTENRESIVASADC